MQGGRFQEGEFYADGVILLHADDYAFSDAACLEES